MKSKLYVFDALNPDAGARGESGLGAAINLCPVAGIYTPGPGCKQIRLTNDGSAALNDYVTAMHPHKDFIVFINTNNDVYVSDVYGTAETAQEYAITPVSWNSSTTENASFATFGDSVYIADHGNQLHSINLKTWTAGTTKATKPTPASGATLPGAKHIVSHGGHLVAMGIELFEDWGGWTNGDEYSNLVWWSGFDDPTSFGSFSVTPELKGSDFRFLYETDGPITGAISTGDNMFIFKERSVFLSEGPPFRFSLLTNDVGTVCPNAILFHNGWVYFMAASGPARINVRGEVELLTEGKVKSTLYSVDWAPYYKSSVFGYIMQPFSFEGIWGAQGGMGPHKVYAALSEQYNTIYFLYPSRQENEWDTFESGIGLKRVTAMMLMAYDIGSGNIGFSYPLASNAEGTPIIPWDIYDIANTYYNHYRGSFNMFGMVTLEKKPSKGKAKDVLLLGTSDPAVTPYGNGISDLRRWENYFDKEWYYLEPTIFFGKSWSMYSRCAAVTKIIEPEPHNTRIRKVRPLMRMGYGAESFSPRVRVVSISNKGISGEDIYNVSPINEIRPYTEPDPPHVHCDESELMTREGSVLMDNTVFAPEHIIFFEFDTDADGGPTAQADFMTSTGFLGIEYFYDEQGDLSS